MKRGFTIIEAMIVLAIFGVLLTVGGNFLISVMRNSSQIARKNEVRQEASKIMQDIVAQTRRSEKYIIPDPDDEAEWNLIISSPSGTTTYFLNPQNQIVRNGAIFSSNNVIVSEFNVSDSGNSLEIVLTVQQNDESITLTDTVTPRSY